MEFTATLIKACLVYICSFWPSDSPRIAAVSVACTYTTYDVYNIHKYMPVGHGLQRGSFGVLASDQERRGWYECIAGALATF